MRTKELESFEERKPRERKPKSATQALSSLMRLCARSEKSSGDAMRLMRTWRVPEEECQGVLQKLIDQRFIDDRRYAEAYTREKSSLAGWGRKKIALQLRAKGVVREIVDEVLASLDSDEQAERLADKLQRKLRSTKAASEYELRGKLLRYALSLGYDYDMALDAIGRVVSDSDD
ncbi:MAG: RecX family transcriptional regulator [Alistipes sp.]|nr:RecX family transcriptional regulator [Alistipes sp.]